MDDVSRWVNLTFVFAGLLLWWFFAHVVEWGFEFLDKTNDPFLGENLSQASIAGLVIAVVVTLVLWRNKKLYEQGLNIAREVKKVTWPNLEETKSATRVVIVTTLIIACILAVFDLAFQKLTALILGVDS